MKKGRLFVISGPSGVGKGTVCRRLLSGSGRRNGNDIELSVSMTTRAPRPSEEEGVSYFFTTEDVFRAKIKEDGFLEYAEVFGNLYGTPKDPVMEILDGGRDVLLEIDVQGALQVKENYPESLLVFILPPSLAELRKRIEGRGSENAAQIAKRLNKAAGEIGAIGAYDYAVVNEDIGRAVKAVKAIMTGRYTRLVREEANEIADRFSKEAITTPLR
jgi:guanylate kinase